MNEQFTHLHVHTEYSFLDGTINIKQLMQHLKSEGMTSCAITDHGNLCGTIDFFRLAKEANIKPILGCEFFLCENLEDKTRKRLNA